MTTHRQTRCRHCQVRYHFQASGHGAPELNSHEWCPDCYQVYLDVFKAVPVRVEKVYVGTDEVTAFELEALEDQRWETTKAKGGIPIRRIAAPLFDMKDPSNVQTCGITGKGGKTFRWSYWSKDPKGTAEVHVAMEKNLGTGETVPWVDLR